MATSGSSAFLDAWTAAQDGNVYLGATAPEIDLGFLGGSDAGAGSTSRPSGVGATFLPPGPGTFCDNPFPNGEMGNCPEAVAVIAEATPGAPTLTEIEMAIQSAFQSLPVAPSPINYQPDGTWAAVNMDFIVYTDRNEQVLGTTIFDIPVTFTLTPVHWTWDFGDGSTPLQTSRVGAPYPNQTVSHVYTTASDGVTVSVTTLWSGTFTIADDPTPYPVNGFVTTTNSAGPVEIVAFKIVLVPNPGES